MRTTVRLSETLMRRAKREAERRGVTLTSLIEQGLHLALRQPDRHEARAPVILPVCRKGGGTLPGIDLDDTASLLDRMDDRA